MTDDQILGYEPLPAAVPPGPGAATGADTLHGRALAICDALPATMYLPPSSFPGLGRVLAAYRSACAPLGRETHEVTWLPIADHPGAADVAPSRAWLRTFTDFITRIPPLQYDGSVLRMDSDDDPELLHAMLALAAVTPARRRRRTRRAGIQHRGPASAELDDPNSTVPSRRPRDDDSEGDGRPSGPGPRRRTDDGGAGQRSSRPSPQGTSATRPTTGGEGASQRGRMFPPSRATVTSIESEALRALSEPVGWLELPLVVWPSGPPSHQPGDFYTALAALGHDPAYDDDSDDPAYDDECDEVTTEDLRALRECVAYVSTAAAYLDDVFVHTGPHEGYFGADEVADEFAPDLPLLTDDDQASDMPILIDVTPIGLDYDYDVTWSRWLADADAWLAGPGHHIPASAWLGHLIAAWDSPRRIIVANQVMATLSGARWPDPGGRARCCTSSRRHFGRIHARTVGFTSPTLTARPRTSPRRPSSRHAWSSTSNTARAVLNTEHLFIYRPVRIREGRSLSTSSSRGPELLSQVP